MSHQDDCTDATESGLPRHIANAKAGDVAAKRRLLEIFCWCADNKRPVYPQLLEYMSEQLTLSLDSKDLHKALGINLGGRREKNRPPNPELKLRNEMLAMEVHDELMKIPTPKQAPIFVDVGNRLGFSKDQVRNAYIDLENDPLVNNLPPYPHQAGGGDKPVKKPRGARKM